jgi:hypothetical protein
MKFEVNIDKKYFFVLLASFLLIGGVVGVIAYNSGGPPSVIGHSFEELQGAQARIGSGMTACAGSNRAIKTINPETGAVTCEVDDAGGGSSPTPECLLLGEAGGGTNFVIIPSVCKEGAMCDLMVTSGLTNQDADSVAMFRYIQNIPQYNGFRIWLANGVRMSQSMTPSSFQSAGRHGDAQPAPVIDFGSLVGSLLDDEIGGGENDEEHFTLNAPQDRYVRLYHCFDF